MKRIIAATKPIGSCGEGAKRDHIGQNRETDFCGDELDAEISSNRVKTVGEITAFEGTYMCVYYVRDFRA